LHKKEFGPIINSPAGSIAPQVLICEAILIHNSDLTRLSFGVTHPTIGRIKLIKGNNCSATLKKKYLKKYLSESFYNIRSILSMNQPTFAKASKGENKKALPIGHRKSFDGINKVE